MAAPSRSVRSLALGILVRVERDRAHAAPLIDARSRGLAARDADLLRALVKTCLRNQLLLDHVLARHVRQPVASLDAAVRGALRLGAAQLLLLTRVPAHAAVAETVDAAREMAPRAVSLVNAVLRRVAAAEQKPPRVKLPDGADPLEALSLETSHPLWLVRRWVERFGEAAARAALEANQADSPVDLLADPLAGPVEEIRAALARDGVETEPSPWAPLALTVVRGNPFVSALVSGGKLAVVDAAAQGLMELVPPAPIVLDMAAAPGGKTRVLLARGLARRVIALERNRARARRLRSNLAAAGRLPDALAVQADAATPPIAFGAIGSIVLDAPCSGTGTLRKNPEARYRLTPEDLPPLAARQRELLARGLDLLPCDGALVYVTCSIEPEENEDVVRAVLGSRADAELVEPDRARLPGPLAGSDGGVVRVLPGTSNDGFTAIVLAKRHQAR